MPGSLRLDSPSGITFGVLLNLALACRSAEVADPVRLLNLLPVVAAGWLPFRQHLGRRWQGGGENQQGSEQEMVRSEHGPLCVGA